MEMKGP